MPQFVYRAKKGPKEVVDGTLEAATVEEAIEKLDALGLLPVRVEEAGVKAQSEPAKAQAKAKAAADKAPALRKSKGGSIKSAQITMFGRQLSSLIKSGVPILKAFWIISEQTDSQRLKAFLEEAQTELRNGSPLSSVLVRYPKLFPPIYIAMVRTGEDSGTLQETLLRVSDYRRKQEELFSKVRQATAYPMLMALTGAGTILFMLSFVIPKLTTLFATMGESLPMPTRILMAVSGALKSKVFWAVAAAVTAAAVSVLRMKNERMSMFWSRTALSTPFIKDFVIKTELARFSRTLELLVHCGTPIMRAIEITTPVVENRVLREIFAKTQKDLAGGGTLGQTLKASRHIPLFMTNLVSVGEESGNLDEALGEIASFYESETEEAVKIITSLLEPLMILGMGLIVGFIVIAMLLPMFELNMAVK